MAQAANYRMDWRKPGEVSDKCERAAVRVIVDEAKEEVYNDTPQGRTGNLRKSVGGRVIEGGRVGVVEVKDPHAHLLHDGVVPHETSVVRKDGRAIRFWDSAGAMIFRRVTRHPGIQGDPWVERAVDRVMGQLDPLLAKAGARIEKEIA